MVDTDNEIAETLITVFFCTKTSKISGKNHSPVLVKPPVVSGDPVEIANIKIKGYLRYKTIFYNKVALDV